jgi:hypothetical protein
VEVHQSGTGSSDIVFGAELFYKSIPDLAPPTVIRALEGPTLDKVQVVFSEPLDIATAQSAANYSIALGAGGTLNVLSAVLSGTDVVLTTSPRTAGLAYSVAVKNVRDTSQNVLAPVTVGIGSRVVLFAIDDKTLWRYDRSGTDLGTTWRDKNFNDSSWPQGPALLADETGAMAEPIRTPINRMNDAGEYVATFYFRTHFNFSGDPTTTQLQLRHVVDDGAIFYLNGTEISRFGYAAGVAVLFNNTAATSHEGTVYEGPFTLPAGSLVVGDNVLAVEVHQAGTTSSDVVFGAELVALLASPAVTPPTTNLKFTSVTRNANNLRLEWTGTGLLQSANAVTGPWADMTNATSPFSESISGTVKFYRLK